MSTAPIRVLIADDSSLFAEGFAQVLRQDAGISVVGVARTGREAVEMTSGLRPDLVTMDLHMPEGGGLLGVEGIMSTRPTPIVVLTGDPNFADASLIFEALSRGALELMPKPQLVTGPREALAALREHLKLLASVPVLYHAGRLRRPEAPEASARRRSAPTIIGVVASTGGPSTLAEMLSGLPASFPAGIVVVQHLAAGFIEHLAAWLQASTSLKVSVAAEGTSVNPGHVLLAPDGVDLEVDGRSRVRFERGSPPSARPRPSGDALLSSLARSFGHSAAGVVLTGMGRDGSAGLVALRRAGGITVAQAGHTAVIDGMPAAARETGAVDYVVEREHLAEALISLVTRGRLASVPPVEAR